MGYGNSQTVYSFPSVMVAKMLENMKMEVGVWRSPGPLVHFLGSQEGGRPGWASKDLLIQILLGRDDNFRYGPCSATEVTNFETEHGLSGGGQLGGKRGLIICNIESGVLHIFTTGPFPWQAIPLKSKIKNKTCAILTPELFPWETMDLRAVLTELPTYS